jgi:hypothetical protein
MINSIIRVTCIIDRRESNIRKFYNYLKINKLQRFALKKPYLYTEGRFYIYRT